METFIERAASDNKIAQNLKKWKEMRNEGWALTVLLSPDKKTVVAFGYRVEIYA